MIKAIIFDMGGVLVKTPFFNLYDKLSNSLKVDFDKFRELRNEYPHLDKYTGKISEKAVMEEIKEKLESDADILELYKKIYLKFSLVNKELLNYIKKLKEKYKITSLTNTTDLRLEINQYRKLFKDFNLVIASCEVGLVKPDKKIFKLILEKLELNAEECVFIDDRKDNIDIANKIGFNTIHYINNEQTLKELNVLLD